MRRLFIALSLTPVMAFATVYEMPNQAGGKIVLEEHACVSKSGKRYASLKSMFTISSSGKRYSGCWYYADGYVHVVYTDGSEYTYPANNFTTIKDNNL